VNNVEASLRINGYYILTLYWHPYLNESKKSQFGATSLTQSGTFHLNKNDVVDIFGIPNNFDPKSSLGIFTGYLIIPD
jgi:hypothetical protein